MTSEEGKEDSKEDSTAGVGGPNPPMTHVSADVLKEFISESQVSKDTSKTLLANEAEDFSELDSNSQSDVDSVPKTNGTLSGVSSPHKNEENGETSPAASPKSPSDVNVVKASSNSVEDSNKTSENPKSISLESSPKTSETEKSKSLESFPKACETRGRSKSSSLESSPKSSETHKSKSKSLESSPKACRKSKSKSNSLESLKSNKLMRTRSNSLDSSSKDSVSSPSVEPVTTREADKGPDGKETDSSTTKSTPPTGSPAEETSSASNEGTITKASALTSGENSSQSEVESKEESPEESSQLEDDILHPGTPRSEASSPLSLEESLLKGGEHDDGDEADDDFCEEKLLQEQETEKELSDDARSLHLFNDISDGSKGPDEGSSDASRQDKEIEKILRNLDNSLADAEAAGTEPAETKTVETTKDADEEAETKIKTSEDPVPPKSSLGSSSKSLPVPEGRSDEEKFSDKRSLPSDFADKSKNVSFKMFRKGSLGGEPKEGKTPAAETKGSQPGEEGKGSKPSTGSQGPNTLTFSEALKSIAVEERLNSLTQTPVPLVPTTEGGDVDVGAPSPSLTVLQPLTPRPPKPLTTLTPVPSSPAERGSKRAAEDSEEDHDPSVPKPDLKKVRVFPDKKEEGPKKPSPIKLDAKEREVVLTELSKQMSHVKTMESRLLEEKALQEAKQTKDVPRPLEKKEKTLFIDEGELERRTVQEMRDAASGSNKLKRIKRKDLESLVIELFVDKVLYEHQLGQQKDLCKRLEATLETNRKKAAQFHKEVEDLKKVTQRLQAEHLARKSQVIAPVKVKRSVGIQATPTIIGKGLMHTSSSGSIRVLSASPGTPTWNSQVSHTSPNPVPKPADPPLNHIATQSTPIGPVRPLPGQSDVVKTTQFQATRVVSTQAITLPNSSSPTTQMVMVNPVMVQSPNGGVGSPILPVGTTRLVRTPLTPLATSALASPAPTLQPGTVATPPKTSSNVIDLTDDEEASKTARAATTGTTTTVPPGSVLALQRTPGVSLGPSASGQFVTLNTPSSVGQLVLVPSAAPGQPTTALVVGSVANNPTLTSAAATAGVRSAVMAPGTRFSTAPATIPSGATRVVVNGSFVPHSAPPRHPAPLPRAPPQQTSGYSKKLPPVPILKLSHKDNSIVLSWNMARTEEHERVASYQLYAYQEGTTPPVPSLWKKVGSVKALELPMACTLTQFMPGHVYHFAVRAVDIRSRLGPFSEPRSIRLGK